MSLENEADAFINRFLSHTSAPQATFDPDWPSECEQGTHWQSKNGEQEIKWLPILRASPYMDFKNLEAALEFPIHDDIKTHYGRYWSANIPAHAADGDLSLLYLWNQEDVDNLIENLIGHAVACRNNKTPFAIFFAVAEPDSDYFLTVNNTTGEVQLEEPGKKPLQTLAPDLTTFMASLMPGWKNE
ncbi:MAG: SecY interacting protein Syd [Limisphaerales bacterium]|jgi:SecY interacting protein Syd